MDEQKQRQFLIGGCVAISEDKTGLCGSLGILAKDDKGVLHPVPIFNDWKLNQLFIEDLYTRFVMLGYELKEIFVSPEDLKEYTDSYFGKERILINDKE